MTPAAAQDATASGRAARSTWRVAVIGAGLMGRGIAQSAAVAGSGVLLHDTDPLARERALARVRESLDRAAASGRIEPEAAREALERIDVLPALGDEIGGCDAVVEAVVEDARVKHELFARLDGLARPGALLASNTSALSITELAAATGRREDVVGMHFFNPVPRMRLVEIVVGLETSAETVERARALAEHLGKETVVVRDSAGFVTTRVNAVIGNEAFAMLTEGVASAEDIDRALRLGLNHPMGPFELVDLVGLDTRLSVLEHLHATFGEKYRPSPLLRQYVASGRLGRKVGRGVFDYAEPAGS